MKFITEGNIKQFGCIGVVCGDRVMAELLSCNPFYRGGLGPDFYLARFADFRCGSQSMFEWVFRSGAKLKVGDKPNRFHILGYSSDYKDGLAAMDELRLMETLRQAEKHASAMHDKMGSYTLANGCKKLPKMRVVFDY